MADQAAARAAVSAGTVSCPLQGCLGMLRAWSKARSRPIVMGGGQRVLVRPDRARCRGCGVTQVLLPASCLPRRAYGAEVIGAVLNAAAEGTGYRRAATRTGVPASTARAWIRSITSNAGHLSGTALRVIKTLGADTGPAWISGPDAVHPVRAVLQVLGTAARALVCSPATTARSRPGTLTGIDYLGLLATGHRLEMGRWLRLIDPSQAAATAPPWHQVTMITGGQLLTGPRSG